MRTSGSGVRPTASIALGAICLGMCAGALVACGGSDGPDPDAALRELATAFGTGDFDAVDFSDTTATKVSQDYARITDSLVDGLGGEKTGMPTVKAGAATVSEDGGQATATLTWRWPVQAKAWSYTTAVTLVERDSQWQVHWEPRLVSAALTNDHVRLSASSITAVRGDIVGAGGVDLVTPRAVISYGIDKTQVSAARAPASARALARLFDLDVSSYVKKVKAAGSEAYVEAIAYRKEEAPAAAARITRIKGAVALQQTRYLAPTKEFAAPILGTVGEVTAEMIKKNPGVYQVGDTAGLSGLEARYDERLRGTAGTDVELVGASGKMLKELFRAEPVDGKALRLTMSEKAQSLAESLLDDVKPASALVAIRPSTGAIIAAANGPGNDGINIATYGQAAPGSTFKTIDSLALLRQGLTPSSTISCPSTITVDGKEFGNDSWYPSSALGKIPLSLAVAQSCNTAMIGQRDRISHADLVAAAASLGFGVDHDTGFSSYFGQLPKPASQTEHAADLIGQGKVLASPMVMATVMASIEAGKTVVPRLVQGVAASAPDSAKPLSAKESAQLRTIFRRVVTEGTGSGLLDVPGKPVIAKTGTAEFDRNGTRLTHTWMIAAQGDLAVAVYVDVGTTGSATAGPIVESFLRGM
ncbi:MAG: penicillin-binding transpeptidase domain-containing protein [Nocardioides sp.]|uniref:penicillin-binding transpeptidase domain-containing protein n=1 Tax=Nocardioides sp. TaxID=35761 RepID=UPI0039E497B3